MNDNICDMEVEQVATSVRGSSGYCTVKSAIPRKGMAQTRGGHGLGLFIKGQVVKVLFPFSNLSGSKKRPALLWQTSMGTMRSFAR